VQITEYLSSLPDPSLVKTHADILRLGEQLLAKPQPPWVGNRIRVEAHRREASTSLKDQPYLSAVNEARQIVNDVLTWEMATYKLDALISPTSPPARLIAEESTIIPPGWRTFASMTGWPDLTVPVGFTTDPALPVGMSFLGPAFTEPKLLGFAAAVERALPLRRVPVNTPPLPAERIDY
jgi:amidase